MSKPTVAFICVHNSCRSQIAEALGRHLAGDVFDSYSAGTETKPQINQDAVRLMKEIYDINMEAEGQHSKLIDEIPEPDIAISMGCNVGCPFIGRPFDDNWGLDDPTGQADDVFRHVIGRIEERVLQLKEQLYNVEKHESAKGRPMEKILRNETPVVKWKCLKCGRELKNKGQDHYCGEKAKEHLPVL